MNGAWVFIVFGIVILIVAKPFAARQFEYMNRGRQPPFRSPYGPKVLRTITWANRLTGVFSVALGLTIWINPDFLRTSGIRRRCRDENGQGWADIIDLLTMYPDARRRVVTVLGDVSAER